VPLHLRNATTKLMRDWGYAEGYKYAHDFEGGYTPQQCLPDEIAGVRFYEPSDRGYEPRSPRACGSAAASSERRANERATSPPRLTRGPAAPRRA
jgi:replication-associated recombination protein RarA